MEQGLLEQIRVQKAQLLEEIAVGAYFGGQTFAEKCRRPKGVHALLRLTQGDRQAPVLYWVSISARTCLSCLLSSPRYVVLAEYPRWCARRPGHRVGHQGHSHRA